MRLLDGGLGVVVMASIIFDSRPWGLDRGWEQHRVCRQYLKDSAGCRHLAEETFKRNFPTVSYIWPTCGKDDVAEAVLWSAVVDRSRVSRYMEEFRRLCR